MTRQIDSIEPRIWFDVTTSSNWHRPPVGVVRVEQQLSRELAKIYGDRFGLCVLENGAYRPYGLPTSDGAATTLFWPDRSRREMPSATLDFVSGNQNVRALRVDRINSDTVVHQKETVSHEPAYGDIIISVGLDWEHGRVDLFHELKKKFGFRFVTCCYDLIPVLYPQYCVGEVAERFKVYFSKIAWSSDLILCISQNTLSDYLHLSHSMGFPSVPTHVMELGDNVQDCNFSLPDADMNDPIAHVIETPFIIYVSTIERRKNHEVLYKAYHLLAAQGKIDLLPTLVFVGMAGWGVSDLLKDIELNPLLRKKLVQFHHVSDRELMTLYKYAEFVVYPSFYEGWGLPVGEALALGKAVIASPAGSIYEVGKDLVIYADPWNPHDWASKILHFATNSDALSATISRVKSEYKKRNWSDTAISVKEAIASLVVNRVMKCITLYPGYDMHSLVGIQCSGAVLATGIPGVLVYGPYRALPRGIFEVRVYYDKLSRSVGKFCIAVVSDLGNKIHSCMNKLFDQTSRIDAMCEVKNVTIDQAVSDFEVTIHVDEGLMISINKIEIHRIL